MITQSKTHSRCKNMGVERYNMIDIAYMIAIRCSTPMTRHLDTSKDAVWKKKKGNSDLTFFCVLLGEVILWYIVGLLDSYLRIDSPIGRWRKGCQICAKPSASRRLFSSSSFSNCRQWFVLSLGTDCFCPLGEFGNQGWRWNLQKTMNRVWGYPIDLKFLF